MKLGEIKMFDIFITIRRYRILQALLYIVMGLFLVTNPNAFFKSVIYLLSSYFIFFGLIGFIQSYKTGLKQLSPTSIGFIIIGISILVFSSPLVKLANILLGIFIVLNGLSKLKEGHDIRKKIVNDGLPIMIYGGILMLVGVVILFNPFSTWLLLIKVVGVVLIVMGILDFIGYFRYRNISF